MLMPPEDEVEHGVDEVLGDVARRAVLHSVLVHQLGYLGLIVTFL